MSISEYLKKYLLLIALYSFLAFTISQKTVVGGFLSLTLTCLVVTVLASRFFLQDKRLQKIVISTFFLKLLIGIVFYMIFHDSNYFSGNGDINRNLQADFTSYFDFTKELVEGDQSLISVFLLADVKWGLTHPEILAIISAFLAKFGVHALNLLPLNCFFSSLFAINIYLCVSKLGIPNDKKHGLMLLLSLFPLFLDNAIFVRDITGQFIMSIGVCLIALSSEKYRMFWLFPAAALFFLQRTAYIMVPFLVFAVQMLQLPKYRKYILLTPVIAVIAIILSSKMQYSVADEVSNRSDGGIMSTSPIMLPVRLIFGLIGPFPWTQFVELGLEEPAYASQIFNYPAAVIHIGCLMLFFTSKKIFLQLLKIDVFMMGLIIMAMGVIDSHMHISYIMSGTCFMVPYIYLFYDKKIYKTFMIRSLFTLISLNIFLILLGGGVKSLLI